MVDLVEFNGSLNDLGEYRVRGRDCSIPEVSRTQGFDRFRPRSATNFNAVISVRGFSFFSRLFRTFGTAMLDFQAAFRVESSRVTGFFFSVFKTDDVIRWNSGSPSYVGRVRWSFHLHSSAFQFLRLLGRAVVCKIFPRCGKGSAPEEYLAENTYLINTFDDIHLRRASREANGVYVHLRDDINLLEIFSHRDDSRRRICGRSSSNV